MYDLSQSRKEIAFHNLPWKNEKGELCFGGIRILPTQPGSLEMQLIECTSSDLVSVEGTFTLHYGPNVTAALPVDCSSVEMTDALQALPNMTGTVTVRKLSDSTDGIRRWTVRWTVTILQPLPLSVDSSNVTGDATLVASIYEPQGNVSKIARAMQCTAKKSSGICVAGDLVTTLTNENDRGLGMGFVKHPDNVNGRSAGYRRNSRNRKDWTKEKHIFFKEGFVSFKKPINC